MYPDGITKLEKSSTYLSNLKVVTMDIEIRRCIFVKINSKYKEDDFSDSNADVNSQCLCTQEASTPHVSNPRSP